MFGVLVLSMGLEKHGYRRGLTSTEYLFKVLDELIRASHDKTSFTTRYLEIVNTVLRERSTNTGSINLLRRVGEYVLENGVENINDYLLKLRNKCDNACSEAAKIAANRVVDGDVLITNSDSLCIRRMFKYLVEMGVRFSVYVTESRPGMEGFNLASYLDNLGVKTYLIIDSAARFFMKDIDKAFVGAEAIAVNGAVIGKTGTSVLCLAATEARVHVFVVAPLYKFSFETIHGELLKLPEAGWELLMDNETRKSLPENYVARAPLYDVTPPHLIDGIVTEYGLFAPQAIPVILRQLYGSFPPKLRPLNQIIEELRREK